MSKKALTRYQATAAANVVVSGKAGILVGITVGKDVAGGIVEISDHASDGDGNVIYYLEDPPVGYYPINRAMVAGIAADLTTQTNVTFHFQH